MTNQAARHTAAGHRPHRHLHLHPGYVLLVALGGIFGAGARYGLGLALPAPGGWPLPTLLINLAGALALGVLLEGLSRRGPDAGRRRVIRLLAGTGFLGAFTTYSALAMDSVHLFDAGRAAEAAVYLAASLIGGAAATTAGVWGGARHHRTVLTRQQGLAQQGPTHQSVIRPDSGTEQP
ncbi:fluoride efflux transporter FluC [Pseudarthrobacter sp. N5]|uniref:fluoride efflux transporter FluC n=1 Tax=Pseudarthrobacter sp. N5 TaxID=3418416 RepID=UPI003CEA1D35